MPFQVLKGPVNRHTVRPSADIPSIATMITRFAIPITMMIALQCGGCIGGIYQIRSDSNKIYASLGNKLGPVSKALLNEAMMCPQWPIGTSWNLMAIFLLFP